MLKFILELPRKLLAHSINILIAIPFTFIGLLARALAEWIFRDPKPNNTIKSEKPTNSDYLNAMAYLHEELAKKDALEKALLEQEAILKKEIAENWESEVELEIDFEGDEDEEDKTIH